MTRFSPLSLMVMLNVALGEHLETWEVMTNPIILGEEVVLKCMMPYVKCNTTEYLQWSGGKGYKHLCLNGNCAKREKYRMNIDRSYNFELVIVDFTLDDIDCVYTCSCRFNDITKMFSAKENMVYKLPSKIIDTVILQHNALHINLTLESVQPVPNCSVYYVDKLVIESVHFVMIPSEMFFDVQYHQMIALDCFYCQSTLKVVCHFASRQETIIQKDFNTCEVDETNTTLIAVLTAVTLCAVIFIVLIFCTSKAKGKDFPWCSKDDCGVDAKARGKPLETSMHLPVTTDERKNDPNENENLIPSLPD